MRLSDAIRRVIDLAAAIRDYWDTELPKRHPHYPLIRAGEDSGPPPPQEDELRAFLRALPPDDLYAIMAIMYLGRGDYNAVGVAEERRRLMNTFPDPDYASRFMMSKGPLAEYLQDGLATLAADGIDVDTLHLAPA